MLDAKFARESGGNPLNKPKNIWVQADGLRVTDWNSAALCSWSRSSGVKTITDGFKGLAAFDVLNEVESFTAYAPDFLKSAVRVALQALTGTKLQRLLDN